MELVKEEWTPCSVTSLFRLPSPSEFPLFQSFCTDKCGLGWHFTIGTTKQLTTQQFENKRPGRKYAMRFAPHSKYSASHGAAVNVVGTFIPAAGYSALLSATSEGITLQASSFEKLLTLPEEWTLQGLLCQAFVSFTVTVVDPCPANNIMTFLHKTALADPLSRSAATSANLASDMRTAMNQPAVLVDLARSLRTGVSFDTKFIAFSHRQTAEGKLKLSGARTIYANTAVLQAVSPALALQCSPGQKSSLLVGVGKPSDQQPLDILDVYDYESDSDLDEEEDMTDLVETADLDTGDEGIMADPKAVTEEGAEVMDSNGGVDHSSLPTPGREASELTAPIVESVAVRRSPGSDTVISASSSSAFEDDESAVYVQAQDEGPGDVQPSNGAPSVSQTILVKGAAYRTWQALIYYCYTGQTAFAPLKSRGVITARSSEHDSDATTCTPCSPKSMYRLADALGIDALKDAALAAIRNDLSKGNILGETFSKFTSKYPAIQDMEVALLIKHRSAREVVQEFPVKIQMIFRGEIPHAEKAHADFMQRLLQI